MPISFVMFVGRVWFNAPTCCRCMSNNWSNSSSDEITSSGIYNFILILLKIIKICFFLSLVLFFSHLLINVSIYVYQDMQHKSPKPESWLPFRWIYWWSWFAKRSLQFIISYEQTRRLSVSRNLVQCTQCTAEFLEHGASSCGDQRERPRRVPPSPRIHSRVAPPRHCARRIRARVRSIIRER